jgi:DNA-binding transcriptional LysR family regulator
MIKIMHNMNLSRIDLNLLVIFDAIARTRSVTRAAERVALSQPAVSHALARLRELLGDPLFVRGRGGLAPTARAQALADPVRAILAEVSAALAPADFDPQTARRTFHIGVSDYSSAAALPSVMRTLRAIAPNVAIEAQTFGEQSFARLESGELDCSFWGGGPLGDPFRSRALFRDPFVGLVCARHPLAKAAQRGAIGLDAFLAYPHVVVTVGAIASNAVDLALAARGRARRIALTAPHFSVNFAILPGTDLVMAAPSRLARQAERLGLVRFKLPIDVGVAPYALIWHRRADTDVANAWMRETIVSSCAEPVSA